MLTDSVLKGRACTRTLSSLSSLNGVRLLFSGTRFLEKLFFSLLLVESDGVGGRVRVNVEWEEGCKWMWSGEVDLRGGIGEGLFDTFGLF
jgi:hypothetical protein